MVDIIDNQGIEIDYSILSKELKVNIVPIIASKQIGIEKITELLKSGDFLSQTDDNCYQFHSEKEAYNFIENILGKCMISFLIS